MESLFFDISESSTIDTIKNKPKNKIIDEILNYDQCPPKTEKKAMSDYLKKILKKTSEKKLCLRMNRKIAKTTNRMIFSINKKMKTKNEFNVYELKRKIENGHIVFEIYKHGKLYSESLRRPREFLTEKQLEQWLNESIENKIIVL